MKSHRTIATDIKLRLDDSLCQAEYSEFIDIFGETWEFIEMFVDPLSRTKLFNLKKKHKPKMDKISNKNEYIKMRKIAKKKT